MQDADWDPYGGDAQLTPVFGRLRLRTETDIVFVIS